MQIVKRSDAIYEKLQTYLVETAAGGEPLFETALAERFGVSKTPVREALYRLAAEGLVDLIPNRGYFVHRATYEDVRQVFEIREALEGMAARLATPRLSDADLATIRAQFESFGTLLQDGHKLGTLIAESRRVNRCLHDTLVRAARNGRIAESLRQLRAQMEHIIRVLAVPARYDESYHEHLAIVAALDARNADGAEAAMRRHISSLKEDMLRLF